MPAESEKEAAASEASKLIHDHMILGLGSGSTVEVLINKFLPRFKLKIIAASRATQLALQAKGIDSLFLDSPENPELTIDGADRVDRNLNLIKGGGAALLGERVLAERSSRYVIIADSSKLTNRLGSDFPVPVEVEPIAYHNLASELDSMAIKWRLRSCNCKNGPAVTDNGNWIVDVDASSFDRGASDLYYILRTLTGVVEVGLFIGIADEALIGTSQGVIRLTRNASK
ncbi:MAG TPA: ribose-5-phosphate isomerase RpiA [Thermoprotei archaeon]|nr:ribose-5-phosphate isomerase RpiA [Thermoprotei archaeon]